MSCRQLRVLAAAAAASLAVAGVAFAQDEAGSASPMPSQPTSSHGGKSYTNDHERGWFWYEKVPTPPPPTDAPPPGSTPDKDAAPPPLSVAWLRIHLDTAREKAIDEPTRENVEYYNYLQKIAMDKAERFAQVSVQTNMMNPTLDETIENPVSTAQRNAHRDTVGKAMAQTLRELGGQYGIFYFYKSDCPYCRRENPLLQDMQNAYGFHILPVAIDHRPLQDGSFPAWVADHGQAIKLNITSTPTLYLFKPSGQLVFLSVGLQTLPELRERILQVAHARNWIDDDTFETALRGSTHRLFLDAVDPDRINWDNSHDALLALRAMSKNPQEEGQSDGLNLPESTPIR